MPGIPCLNCALKEVNTFWKVSLQDISFGQVNFFLSELLKEFTSHAPFLRKTLGDVLHHTEGVNRDKGRQTILGDKHRSGNVSYQDDSEGRLPGGQLGTARDFPILHKSL